MARVASPPRRSTRPAIASTAPATTAAPAASTTATASGAASGAAATAPGPVVVRCARVFGRRHLGLADRRLGSMLGHIGRQDACEVASSLLAVRHRLDHGDQAIDSSRALFGGDSAHLVLDLHLDSLGEAPEDILLGR